MTAIVAIERQSFPKLVKRTIPAGWESRLAEISPPTNLVKYLKLVHEEGYPWEPVDRFLIYEMLPARFMEEKNGQESLISLVLEQLQHPVPPSEMGGYYDHALHEYVPNPDCLITTRAWNLYRETGCWGRPFWVIQGDRGGHKWEFSEIEKKTLRLNNLPAEAPAPGDLPFAEFDERVVEQLQRLDMLKGIHGRLKHTKETTAAQGKLTQERLEREFRVQLLSFLRDQVDSIAGDVTKSLLALDAPRSDFNVKEMERLSEESTDAFLETGHTDGHRRIIMAR